MSLGNEKIEPGYRKALVLGNVATAAIIAEKLRSEGYDPVYPLEASVDIPSPSAPDAVQELRTAIRRFKTWAEEECQGRIIQHIIHPGVSGWADRPELSLIGQELGCDVVGPSARVISLFRNNLTFLEECEKLNIPNLLLSTEPMHGVREIQNFASSRSFPFVLKAQRGSGSLGLFVVRSLDDFESAVPLWLEQLVTNYGEFMVIAERFIEEARLVSIAFARFLDGSVRVFSPVDASLLSRNRKLVEFCPASRIDGQVLEMVKDWVEVLAEKTGYYGVGVFEFLIDGSRAFVTGALPRLNTAFHLWETIDGVNAVRLQLAAMKDIGREAEPPIECTNAQNESVNGVSVRMLCEDSVLGIPQPGFVHSVSEQREWSLPGASAEISLAISPGKDVPIDGDGNIGTLYAFAKNREDSLALARGVLGEVWISGGLNTNQSFCLDLLSHPWLKEGVFNAQFVDEEFVPEISPSQDTLRYFVSLCAATVEAGENDRWAVGDQWVQPDPAIIAWSGEKVSFERDSLRGLEGSIIIPPSRNTRFCVFPIMRDRWLVRLGAWAVPVRRVVRKQVKQRKSIGVASMVNGRVRSVLFLKDANVKAHEPVIVVESMCQLIPHALPIDVTIVKWEAKPEQIVSCGQILAEVKPINPLAE